MVDSFVTGGDICLLTGVSVYGFAILVPAASVGIVPMNSWGDRVHTLPVTAFPGHRVHSIVREIKGDGLLPLGEVWNDAKIETVASMAFVIDFVKSMTVLKERQ